MSKNTIKRHRRKTRIRAIISGTKERPRLSVYRSNRYLFVQLIDDTVGKTLVSVTDRTGAKDKKNKLPKTEQAKKVGKLLGQKAAKKGIKTVVFDRNGYKYHGRVRALAQAARETGMIF